MTKLLLVLLVERDLSFTRDGNRDVILRRPGLPCEAQSCEDLRDGTLLDQAVPEAIPASWTIQLSKVGESVFLLFYNKNVLALG